MPVDPLSAGLVGGDVLVGLATSAFNVHESRQNRRFQRNMSNTAHQREVQDLRAAGINPLLSARHGGSVTPSGSAAQLQSSDIAGKGFQAMQLRMQQRLNEAQISDINAAAQLKSTQAGDITFMQKERLLNLQAQTLAALSQSGLSDAQRSQLKIQAELIAEQIRNLRVHTASSALQLEKDKLLKKPYEVINKVFEKKPSDVLKKFDRSKGFREELKSRYQQWQERRKKALQRRGYSGKF